MATTTLLVELDFDEVDCLERALRSLREPRGRVDDTARRDGFAANSIMNKINRAYELVCHNETRKLAG